jgi:hypothetical protein
VTSVRERRDGNRKDGTMPHNEGGVTVDLTEDERDFMLFALTEYGGSASYKPFPIFIVGSSTSAEFDALVQQLRVALAHHAPMAKLDWARALLLTEISWASNLIGAGLDFATSYRDEEAAPLLRSIQRKFGSAEMAALLFSHNGGRDTYAAETEA